MPTTPGILMGNHRSYIDIALTPSKIPFVIVAKRQVRSWPIIGWGGRAIGTIWVQRESKESRHETRESIKDRLSKGGSVLIYPEGTTFKGPGILDLKPKMFETCAENGFPIHPFALEYKDRDFAWIDDDLFMPHFVKHFGKPAVHVKVKYGQIITGTNGEQLMEKVHDWMDQTVREMRADWDNENEAQ
ncbi:MAG: 1-acyl-sn-glycerol-3-phosphate acyltransferase [Bacteroidetes bacterium]|nr:1-acyl-sn-glycerol-3-phosphate acyltransferase [Bacteroidota bacterium]